MLSQIKEYLLLIIIASALWPFPITSTAIVSLGLVWLIERNYKETFRALLANKLLLTLILFYFLQVFGLLYSADLKEGVQHLEKLLAILVFPLAIVTGFLSLSKFKFRLFWTTTVSTAIAGFICVVYALYRNFYIGEPKTLEYSFFENFEVGHTIPGLYWDYFSYTEFASPLNVHPTYFSLFVAFSIFFLIHTQVSENLKMHSKYIAIYVLLIFLSVCLLLLSSRIVIIGFIICLVAGVIMLILHNGSKRMIFGGSVLIAIVVILTLALPITRYRLLHEVTSFNYKMPSKEEVEATGVSMRMVHWNAAFNLIKKNPIIGVGTGDAQFHMDKAYSKYGYTGLVGLNSHNQYLQIALTSGLIVTLVFILFLLAAFIKNFRTRSYLGAIFFLLFAIACIGEVLLSAIKGVVFFSLFATIFCLKDTNSFLYKSKDHYLK